MGIKNEGFYMDLHRHVVDLTKKNTIERIESNKIYGCSANSLFRTLRDSVVRGGWQDHDGYPLRSQFFEKGKLACSISTRRLAKMVGQADKTIQKNIKKLKEVRWIETSNQYMAKKQTSFTLGYWVEYTDAKGKTRYKETWFKDEVMDGIRLLNAPEKETTIEEDKAIFEEETLSFGDVYFHDTATYFAQP